MRWPIDASVWAQWDALPINMAQQIPYGIVTFVLFVGALLALQAADTGALSGWRKEAVPDVAITAFCGSWFASFLHVCQRVFAEVDGAVAQLYWIGFLTSPFWFLVAVGVVLIRVKSGLGLLHEPETVVGVVSGAVRTVVIATMFWTGITIMLVKMEALGVRPKYSGRAAHTWDVSAFYAWHFAKEVPVLDIPQTAGWKEKVLYSGFEARLLLLGYKLAVIVPTLNAVRQWLQLRRAARAAREKVLRQISSQPGVSRVELATSVALDAETTGKALAVLQRRGVVKSDGDDDDRARYWAVEDRPQPKDAAA